MKVCFFQTGAYASRQPIPAAWPVPPELCDREAAHRSMQIALEQCRLADEMGFDWVSVSEHHYAPRLMTPNPLILAAALTQQVKRARIALLGPLIPLVNPVRTAEEIAMLDAINGGRTVVLFLRGTPNEHLTYGTNPDETREMTREAVELIIRAWTEPQPFGWEGRYFRYRTIAVWPRTLQDPHPPVFYSGNSLESAEFAARNRLGIAFSFLPPARVAEHVAFYRERARAAGWEPAHDQVLYRALAHVAETDEQAQAAVPRPAARRAPAGVAAVAGAGPRPGTEAQAGGDAGAGGPGFGIHFLGSPDTVVRKARELHDAGVGILDLAFAGGSTRRSMELFAERVIPRIRDW
jgi:alkanesulfonate monooxygenase SsuD/methylene tetrahydromethanopterin reductase-like flavin-dependent oxidoreductase (luciferase family)